MVEKEEAVFRSAEMSLVQLYVPTEVSREVVYEIGQLNLVQFRDLNSKVNEFQRSFVKELRKLDNIERQFFSFKTQLDKRDIAIKAYPYASDLARVAPQSEIDEYYENSSLLEDRVNQLIESNETLYKKQQDLQSKKYTIQGVGNFFASNGSSSGVNITDDLETGGVPTSSHSSFIAGVINRDKVAVLQQILWRVLRGNLYYHTEELTEKIYDDKSNTFVEKNFFIIFSHGSLIFQRIKKICESLDASLYDVDITSSLREEALSETDAKLTDLSIVLEQTENALSTELIAISKELAKWWEIIAREKAVYKTMNRCDYDDGRKTLVAEGWIPSDEIQTLTTTVKTTSQSVPTIINVLETTRTPPTFHRTNKFTDAFQNICDAYGIASYREVNPGLPTIITFPFMFAIMFGDLGHGFILFLAALALVLNEKKLGAMKRDEIFDMAFSGRYILLLMGIFSMYTGTLYNDVFSKSMTLFNSGWEWPEHFKLGETVLGKQVGTYAFGIDSAWHGTENALLFTNSYKMKLSILMGYVHMSYSYGFSLVNYLNFHSVIDIVGNFIPGLIFMQGIFGYLSLCIVYKWSVDWYAIGEQPPGLLNMLISMFLSPGTIAEPLYSGQSTVQVVLLCGALICVPWLLLVKPLYFKRKLDKEAAEAQYQELHGSETTVHEEEPEHDDDDEDHEEHNFGDIMIHQVIHTIEFCLNCVSHTASYLRLWALSLAHAQLSTVLWSMTMAIGFGPTGVFGVIMVFCLFAMWFTLTVVILVLMEGTSAMLHSLRLHWVESMSKFFIGGGSPYEPFGFKDLLSDIL
ncbi:V-type proton ATPase subunit a, vacuolar isoform [[Candida] railenensis]|uniref:V-type proton ATPase subunit a n=1 Tax=[Candida] railenensis TaxID=45579 RepID=A0A9P0QQF6_9ASCO|nr:V-type proton ATPase subunit a, vacuolar isoform [[Candida] railenensis]